MKGDQKKKVKNTEKKEEYRKYEKLSHIQTV